MINNTILPTGVSVGAVAISGALLRNPFLAVENDISLREPGVELLPVCRSRIDSTTLSQAVLRVAGSAELTAANCNLFRKKACAAWSGHTDVEIDLSQTTLIDCAGLGALIAIRNLTRERNGVARLMHPTSNVQQMLDLTQTGQLFEIVRTRDNADPAFGPARHN